MRHTQLYELAKQLPLRYITSFGFQKKFRMKVKYNLGVPHFFIFRLE